MLTSWMLSYQFGLENRRVGKHFFLSLVGRSFFLNSLSAKKQEIPRTFFFKQKIFWSHYQIWLQKKIIQFYEILRLFVLSFFKGELRWWRSKGRKTLLGARMIDGGKEVSSLVQIKGPLVQLPHRWQPGWSDVIGSKSIPPFISQLFPLYLRCLQKSVFSDEMPPPKALCKITWDVGIYHTVTIYPIIYLVPTCD